MIHEHKACLKFGIPKFRKIFTYNKVYYTHYGGTDEIQQYIVIMSPKKVSNSSKSIDVHCIYAARYTLKIYLYSAQFYM